MRFISILAVAACSTAFVLPSQEIFSHIKPVQQHQDSWYDDVDAAKNNIWSSVRESAHRVTKAGEQALEDSSNAFDVALQRFESVTDDIAEKAQWLESEISELDATPEDRPHKRPHRKHPHHRHANQTILQLVNNSKYTTKLAFFINQFDDLVSDLNSTQANHTLFAPTDSAFAKMPEHWKPNKEQIKALLSYHLVPELYPAGRVLVSHTAPTLLTSDSLGRKPLPQRLSFHLGFRGLTVNFRSRIIAVNIPASNGVVHGVDSLIMPPPSIIKIIDFLPSEFSTLELGLGKTGLLEKLNTTNNAGATFFAPSNEAFARLGPRITGFLFSEHGLKYLKALLQYHFAPSNTLYSDAFYSANDADSDSIPKGKYHVDLTTLLKDRSLSVDIVRFGGLISIKVNGFSRVAIQDGVAENGVLQVVNNVLIPPKKLGGADGEWTGGEIEVDDLIERLSPLVEFDL